MEVNSVKGFKINIEATRDSEYLTKAALAIDFGSEQQKRALAADGFGRSILEAMENHHYHVEQAAKYLQCAAMLRCRLEEILGKSETPPA